MAKKVIASLKTGKGKDFVKVIKAIKSANTGAYGFKEDIVHKDHVKDFFSAQGESLPIQQADVSQEESSKT